MDLEKLRCRCNRYHRMDGNTNIAMRNRLVTDFNQNPGVFVFLLTTKVTVMPSRPSCALFPTVASG